MTKYFSPLKMRAIQHFLISAVYASVAFNNRVAYIEWLKFVLITVMEWMYAAEVRE